MSASRLSPSPQHPVVVLGAGLAGLAAAYKLSEAAVPVVLVEKEDRVGGLSASVRLGDCIFDYGPHGFHSTRSELTDFYERALAGEFLIHPKFVQIKFEGKYYDYPIRPLDVLAKFSPDRSIRCALSYLSNVLQGMNNRQPLRTAEDYFVSQYGQAIYEIFFRGYTHKVWGIRADELSINFIQNRMADVNLFRILLYGLFPGLSKTGVGSKSEVPYKLVLYYPKLGSGRFPETLARTIQTKGGKVWLNAVPDAVRLKQNRVVELSIQRNGRLATLVPSILVSTIPVTSLAGCMRADLDPEISYAAEKLTYRGLIIVCLEVNKPRIFRPQTLYFYNHFFNRLGQMTSYSPLVAPPGKTGVTAELTCRVGDEIWNCPDRRLANRVITEAADEGFFQPQDVEQTKVLRSGFGYPICALDFEKHLGKIWQRLGTIGNLYSGGRQGLFNYAQMHFALRSGFAIAEHILSGKPKPSRQLRDNFREELFV